MIQVLRILPTGLGDTDSRLVLLQAVQHIEIGIPTSIAWGYELPSNRLSGNTIIYGNATT